MGQTYITRPSLSKHRQEPHQLLISSGHVTDHGEVISHLSSSLLAKVHHQNGCVGGGIILDDDGHLQKNRDAPHPLDHQLRTKQERRDSLCLVDHPKSNVRGLLDPFVHIATPVWKMINKLTLSNCSVLDKTRGVVS